MSSLFNQASLVVEPAVYENGKVYATKPFDGSGDLTFTRASNATRVGPDGLIEKVRTNELTYSNDFSNAAWTKTRSSLVSGQAGYDGTNNAWAYVDTADNSTHLLYQPLSLGATLATFSIYAKAAAVNFLVFRFEGSTGVDYAYFNLSNGTLGTIDSDYIDAEITPAGNGFYRCSVSRILGASGNQAIILSAEADNDPTYAGAGTTALILQNSQVELGDIATDYIATTTAAVSVGPVSGLPRLDYLNSSCPRLLLEPQRTNLALFSEQFDNAAWLKAASAVTATANTAISPSGYQDADTIETNASGARFLYQIPTVTAGAITASVFVKKGTSDWFYLNITDGSNNAGYTFNVNTGVLGQSISSVLTPTASIVDYGNGWYRCIVTATVAGTAPQIRLYVATSSSSVTSSAGANVYAWGAMLEQGAYASSYLNTLSTSVTRVADAASKTGISSLIGQTEGTMFVEVDAKVALQLESNGTQRALMVSDGTNTNRILMNFFRSSGGVSQIEANLIKSTSQASFASVITENKTYKIAFAYKANDFVFYINGVQIGTDTSGDTFSAGTISRLDVGQDRTGTLQQSNPISQALLFTTRLTNAQLAELTTL